MTIRFILLSFFCLMTTLSQVFSQNSNSNKLFFHPDKMIKSPHNFDSEKEAKEIIYNIVNTVGLKPNFEIKAADVDNAAAVVYQGKRFILYNPVFIKQIANAIKTDWAAISILAHEIGHHLNGHTLTGSGSKPPLELEADEFSGFVLQKMGATLQESQAAIKLISSVKSSGTHPGRAQRLASIKTGWEHANNQIVSAKKPEDTKSKTLTTEPKAESSIASKYIYKEVHFTKSPADKYYITIRHNLVKVNTKGLEVIGKLVKSNYGFMLALSNNELFKINSDGAIINSLNKKIGFIINPGS